MAKYSKRAPAGYTFYFYKEVFMSVLAVASVALLLFEYIYHPNEYVVGQIIKFDILVALIFLADFIVQLNSAANKKKYIVKNWYLLLASIPLVDSWAEVLRGLRVFELIRLVRAAEHIHYAELAVVKHKKISKK